MGCAKGSVALSCEGVPVLALHPKHSMVGAKDDHFHEHHHYPICALVSDTGDELQLSNHCDVENTCHICLIRKP